MRRKHRYAWVAAGAAVVVAATGLALAVGGAPGGDARPEAVADRPEPRGDACIHEDPERMRRVHMDRLHAHQDQGVREGRSDPEWNLQSCVRCHAAPEAQQAASHGPSGSEDMAFCASCHEYAAVELDCFQCHSTDPEGRP